MKVYYFDQLLSTLKKNNQKKPTRIVNAQMTRIHVKNWKIGVMSLLYKLVTQSILRCSNYAMFKLQWTRI